MKVSLTGTSIAFLASHHRTLSLLCKCLKISILHYACISNNNKTVAYDGGRIGVRSKICCSIKRLNSKQSVSKMFGKKQNPREQMRQQKRDLGKVQREMTRDRGALERQEKQLENEIKKAAKSGNRQLATTLAKQLVQLRKTKTRNLAASSKITAVGHQATAMQATHKMAGSMQVASKAMGEMNKQISPEDLARTMQNFEKESAKMDMSEEMINDTLESVFDESGDEEEQDAIVSQVLDEIGIEITGKLASAPVASKSLPQASKSSRDEDKEIEDMLAKLKAT